MWEILCDGCNKKTYHNKRSSLSLLPRYLMISFQRYNSRMRSKNSASIRFSDKLKLSSFIDEDLCKSNNSEYNLIGISNHSGSMSFGHYFAYCKGKNGWYECNDSMASKTSVISSSNSSSTACVFIYEKI